MIFFIVALGDIASSNLTTSILEGAWAKRDYAKRDVIPSLFCKLLYVFFRVVAPSFIDKFKSLFFFLILILYTVLSPPSYLCCGGELLKGGLF